MVTGARSWALSVLAGGSLTLPGAWAGNPMMEDIPPVALAAYLNAAALAPCPIDWRTVAAVGKVETNHGRFGGAELTRTGRLTQPITSPAGASGLTQFMPDTAGFYAASYDIDGNHDGVEDFDNAFDATLATAIKLCADGVIDDATEATGRYNGGGDWPRYEESRQYVRAVRSYSAELPEFDAKTMTPVEKDRSFTALVERQWERFVADPWVKLGGRVDGDAKRVWQLADDGAFGSTNSADPAELVLDDVERSPRPDLLDPVFGSRLDQMIAGAPGRITVSSGYRDAAEQMAQRVENCPDPLASASTDCSPATAKVGTSDHEKGIAADLAFADAATEEWAHQRAPSFGLEFDLLDLGETWHVSVSY